LTLSRCFPPLPNQKRGGGWIYVRQLKPNRYRVNMSSIVLNYLTSTIVDFDSVCSLCLFCYFNLNVGHLRFNIYRETFVLFYLIFYSYADASITGFHKGIKWKSSFIKDTHYRYLLIYSLYFIHIYMNFRINFTQFYINLLR